MSRRRRARRVRRDRRRRAKASRAHSRHRARQHRAHRRARRTSRMVARRRSLDAGRRRARAVRCTSRRSTDATSNLVSARHAESAWNPDGKTRRARRSPTDDAIAPVGYNGDPDRTGDREANLLAASSGRLWTVDAPSSPDQQLVEQAGSAVATRIARSATPTRSINSGIARRRCTTPRPMRRARRAQWEALKTKYRPRALAAKSDDELKTVLHDLLRRAPALSSGGDGSRRGVERAPGRDGRRTGNARQGRQRRRRGGRRVVRARRRRARRERSGRLRPDARLSEGNGPAAAHRVHVARAGRRGAEQHDVCCRTADLPDGGPALVNVPGTVAAMYLAWQKFGSKKTPWADLLAAGDSRRARRLRRERRTGDDARRPSASNF